MNSTTNLHLTIGISGPEHKEDSELATAWGVRDDETCMISLAPPLTEERLVDFVRNLFHKAQEEGLLDDLIGTKTKLVTGCIYRNKATIRETD
jgi:hypothetical protein